MECPVTALIESRLKSTRTFSESLQVMNIEERVDLLWHTVTVYVLSVKAKIYS